MKTALYIFIGVISLIAFGIIGIAVDMGGEAVSVAKEEFGARKSLKKYEWFKDAAEAIQSRANTIKVYEDNIARMKQDYKGVPRSKWDRWDKEQYNQWQMEVVGLKASYNLIVKEYNAQSKKFNWKLYETSELPRTFKEYLTN